MNDPVGIGPFVDDRRVHGNPAPKDRDQAESNP